MSLPFTIFRLSDGERVQTGLAEIPADLDESLYGWRQEPLGNMVWDPAIPGYRDAAPPPTPPRNLTKLQFQRLFTLQERIDIRASTDPIVIDGLAMQSIAEDISLQDPDTVQGTHYLEQLGLIGEGRAIQILAGESPPA